jgi:hypothetical protein
VESPLIARGYVREGDDTPAMLQTVFDLAIVNIPITPLEYPQSADETVGELA